MRFSWYDEPTSINLTGYQPAVKSVPFPNTSQSSVPMFSNMQTFQAAIGRAIDLTNENPANSSLVFAGIRWLGTRLIEAEIEIREPDQTSDAEDDTKALPDQPMVYLWNWANPYDTGSVNLKAFGYSWILSGNVYFLKFRNSIGLPVELWYEPHWNVIPRWVGDAQGPYIPFENTSSDWISPDNKRDDPKQFINYYEINRGNFRARLEPEDVIHFKDGKDPNYPRCGISGLTTLLREITGDAKIADYYLSLLATGGMPPYGVSINKDLQIDQTVIDGIKDGLSRLRTGQPAVVWGASFDKLGFNPKEMDNRVARYLAEERFSAVTGIPAACMNLGVGGERAIYNNVAEAERKGTQDVLVPLWGHIADTLTMSLLRDFDQVESHYVDFDLTHVKSLQENEDDKAKRIQALWEGGLLKRSEARTALGYPEDDVLDNVYYVKTGTSTIDAELPPPQEAPSPQMTGLPQSKQIPELSIVRKALNSAPRTVREVYLPKNGTEN